MKPDRRREFYVAPLQTRRRAFAIVATDPVSREIAARRTLHGSDRLRSDEIAFARAPGVVHGSPWAGRSAAFA